MATPQFRSNPFASASAPGKKAAAKQVTAPDKEETVRESVKKSLLGDLDAKGDSLIASIKHSSEEISCVIEKSVKEQLGFNTQKYRDRIKMMKTRLNGNRNAYIREALKKGDIDLAEFCALDDSTLNSDAYFQSKCAKGQEGHHASDKRGQMKGSLNTMRLKPPSIAKIQIIPVNSSSFIDNAPTEEPQPIKKEEDLAEAPKEPIAIPSDGINKDNQDSKPIDDIEPIAPPLNSSSKEEEKRSTQDIKPEAQEGLNLTYLEQLKRKLDAEKNKKKGATKTKKKSKPNVDNDKPEEAKDIAPVSVSVSESDLEPIAKEKSDILQRASQPIPISIAKLNPFNEENSVEPLLPVKEDENKKAFLFEKEEPPHQDPKPLSFEPVKDGPLFSEYSKDNNKDQKKEPDTPIILEEPQEPHLPSIQENMPTEFKTEQPHRFISPSDLDRPTEVAVPNKDISPFIDNSNKMQSFTGRNELNENGLSSSQLDSSSISVSGLKGKYKAINEAKLALETKVEIMKQEALMYQSKIASLKAALEQQSKQSSSQSTEEMLKLDLIKTKQLLKGFEIEKEALVKENNKIKSQLKTYEDNLAAMIEDNKLFRIKTEERFAMYQKEIDQLRLKQSALQSQTTPPLSVPESVPMLVSKCQRPTGMDKLVKSGNEEMKLSEPLVNGINEQNWAGMNDNSNMNGNIYDESKNEMVYDTSSNRGIVYPEEEQFNVLIENNVNYNDKAGEDKDLPSQVKEEAKTEVKHELEQDEKGKDSNKKEVNINDIDDINEKRENLFNFDNKVNSDNVFDEKPPEKEANSPKKELPRKSSPLIAASQSEQKKKFESTINDLFGNSDEEENIFNTNPLSTLPTATKQITAISSLPPKTTTTAPMNIPTKAFIPQQKTITPAVTTSSPAKTNRPLQSKPEEKQQGTPVNNLFNDLENDIDDEIFNKRDGESIFGKSVGNTLFD